ncbi:MAG: hypothetical protein AAF413_01805 [Patescibacteria group bacterium]
MRELRATSLLKKTLLWSTVLFVSVFSLLALSLSTTVITNTQTTQAAPSQELNFQGRLLGSAGELVPDGDYHIEFNLYNTATGGTTQWTETHTTGNLVRIANGYMSVQLGSITSFPGTIDWSEEQWLTINIGGTAGSPSWDGEMNPRLKVTSVPYAFRAGELQGTSGAFTADDLVQLIPGTPQAVNDAQAVIAVNQTGPGSLLQLQGDGSDVFTVVKSGDIYSAGSLDLDGSTVDIGSATQSGALVFNDGSGNTLTLQPGTQTGDLIFTLPNADGAANECLRTDGSGILSFGACGGGGSGDILDGGNTNGASITIGTNDTFDFNIETDGTTRANFQADGDIDFASNTLFVDAVNGAVNVDGASTLESLNVGGALNLGNTTNTNAGTIRWTGTDFEGYDGTAWRSLTAGATSGIGGQFVSSSTANVNTAAYTAVPFDSETFKTAGVTHDNITNNTRVTLDDPGIYYVTYAVNWDDTDGNRRTVECSVRMNGTTVLPETTSYAYARNTNDDKGTNSVTAAIVTIADDEYYEVVCRQQGTGGTAPLVAGQTWTMVTTSSGGSLATVSVNNSTTYNIGGAGAYAHGKVTGTSGALAGGSGASTSRSGVGTYSVTLDTALGNSDYTVLLSLAESAANRDAIIAHVTNQTTAGFSVSIHEGDNGGAAGVLRDRDWFFTVLDGSGSGTTVEVFENDGNSFGAVATLGTNDLFDLNFETNDVVRMTIDSAGDITAIGDVALQGDVDLGDAATDVITFNGQVGSDILPNADDTFDLGSSILRWQDLYLGPASLHIVCNAAECSAAQDWAVGVQEAAGAEQGNFRITNNGSEFFTISNTGNVGIGDTTPAALFTVGAGDAFQVDSSGNVNASGDVTFSGDILGGSPLLFQGATDDSFTTTLQIEDPTANNVLVIPDAGGTLITDISGFADGGNSFGAAATLGTDDLQDLNFETNDVVRVTIDAAGNIIAFGDLDVRGSLTVGDAGTDRATFNAQVAGETAFTFQGATDDAFTTELFIIDPTATRTISFPDASGTVCLVNGDCGYVDLAAGPVQIDNSTNDSIFINKTAAGNILRLQSSGTDVFTVDGLGAVSIANSSTSALSITDAAGTTEFFNVDTVGGVVTITSSAANTSGLRLTNLTSASPTSAGQPIGVDAAGNIVTVSGSVTTGDYDTVVAGTNLDFADAKTFGQIDLAADTTLTASNLVVGHTYDLLAIANGFVLTMPAEVTVIEGAYEVALSNHIEMTVVSPTLIKAKIYNTAPPPSATDEIRNNLTTSQASYDAAGAGDWVSVTQAEYDALATNLATVTRFGLDEADYTTVGRTYLGNFTFGNNAATVPAGGYVFAFKYATDTAAVPAGGKFKFSDTAPNAGYAQLGNTLPAHTPTANEAYFVIKGNYAAAAGLGYGAIWTGSNVAYSPGAGTASDLQWGNGDVQPANTFAGGPGVIQGLSTTTLQW